MYEPNAFRMYANLLDGCKTADIVKFSSDRIPESIWNKLLEDLKEANTKIVIVSLGKDGLKFALKNNWSWGEWIYVHGSKQAVIDSAGAGDWLTAAFLNQLLEAYPAKKAVDTQNIIKMLEKAQTIAQMACNYKGAQGILRDKNGIALLRSMTGGGFWQLQNECPEHSFLECPECGRMFL